MFLPKPCMVGITHAMDEYNLINILLHATSNVHPCVSLIANNMLIYIGRLGVHNNNNVLNTPTIIIIYFY